MRKKICSIGVDVDTLEDYVTAYGYTKNEISCNNHIYTKALPRILDLFDSFGVKATFFVVGKDIRNLENIPILKDIIKRGHEIGNHTMNHLYPFSALPRSKKREEILLMQKLAEDKLGYKVKGFRAPGYGVDSETIQILAEESYEYDSSVHPTCFMPLMNMAMLFISSGRRIFPEMKICFHCVAPLNSYVPRKNCFLLKGNHLKIIEVPITATPYFRAPFYGTFHLLSASWIFDFSYYFVHRAGININYEMHAIDMLDYTEDGLDKWFRRHPSLPVPWTQKQKKYEYVIENFKKHFQFNPIIALAKERIS